MLKRMVGLCMAVLTLVSLLPAAAWAEGEALDQAAAPVIDDGANAREAEPEPAVPETPAEPEVNEESEVSIALYSSATSGSCGENVTWNYDTGSGTLTISGTGKMEDFERKYDKDDEEYYTNAPWQNKVFSRLIVEAGVTHLGSYAFCYLPSITSVELPDSIETIGSGAFEGCTGLTSLKIPPKVTVISQSFCEGCKMITTIDIPSGVTHINYHAFWGTDITTLTIPASVTYIGEDIGYFSYITYDGPKSDWEEIKISSNRFLGSSKNVYAAPFEKGTLTTDNNDEITWEVETNYTLRLTGCGKMPDFTADTVPWRYYRERIKRVIFDGRLFSIGDYAFYNLINLEEFCTRSQRAYITPPYMITSIGENAFGYCEKLTSFPFRDTDYLESIGSWAFHHTGLSGHIYLQEKLESIGSEAFSNCPALTSVRIAYNRNHPLLTIGAFAFYDCANFTDVFYYGTADQWAKVTFYDTTFGHDRSVRIHCSYSCGPDFRTTVTEGTPATCTEVGQSGDTVCAKCGVLVSKGTAIPATGHQWDDGVVTTTAAGNRTGVRRYTCAVCSATKTEVIPMVKGDVDCDGTANILDMALVYAYLTGQKPLSDNEMTIADLNSDDIVDVYDLQFLYEIVRGLRTA